MAAADLRRRSRWATATALAVVFASAASAQAQSANRSLAETLFQDARKLMAEKKYAEACPRFAESQRLDPATGTLLNLAACHAEEGKLASAWVEFNDALDAARRDGRADREKFARDHLNEIQPRISHVTLVVPDAARAPGLVVKLDGTEIGTAAWGLSAPVDPGAHEVVASAPGRRSWNNRFTVGAVADNRVVQVPLLGADAPPPAVAPVVAPAPVTPPPVVAEAAPASRSPVVTAQAPAEAAPGARSSLRTASYIVGGAGVAALGVGTVFGLRAFSKWSDRNTHCPDGTCDEVAVSDSSAASTAATVADVAFGVGLAAVATGAILWFYSRPDDATAGSNAAPVALAPSIGTAGGGLVLTGTW